jgi:hypothetical protein
MEVESIGSLKVTVIGTEVSTPVALFGGSNTAIVGGTLSGSVAVKLMVTAVLKGFPTRSVMPVVVWAVMTAPTKAVSWATGRAMDAVLFASLYTGVAATGVVTPLLVDVTENVVALIFAGSIDSLKVTVMLMLAGAVVVVGNVDSTEGGIASIMPVIGATVTLGTVPTVAETKTVAVLATGPAAAPLKTTLKVQLPAGAIVLVGGVKQGLAGSITKSAAFAPCETIEPIVSGLAAFRFVTVTVVVAVENGAGRCAGKAMVEGVTDIPITFPSRVNRFVVPLIAPPTVTEVTGVPVTVTSAMESPT